MPTIQYVGAGVAAGAGPGSITLPMLASQADQTIVGNVSGGAASPIALTATQVRTMLAVGPWLMAAGTAADPSYAWSGGTGYTDKGLYSYGAHEIGVAIQGLVRYRLSSVLRFIDSAGTQQLYISSQTGNVVFGSGEDLTVARLAAASLRQGADPSATPVAQLFTLGEASRPGTDSNVGGANGTIRSGLGTGTGTASSFIIQTPSVAASGSGTQSYATRLTVRADAVAAAGGTNILISNVTAGYAGLCFNGIAATDVGIGKGAGSGELVVLIGDSSNYGYVNAGSLYVTGTKVVGAQGAAVADASGGATIDAEARTALNALLARVRAHGLIAT